MDILGIDPGPVTGIVRLRFDSLASPSKVARAEAMQVTRGLVIPTIEMFDREASGLLVLAIERFVVGPRASRSATPSGGADARDVVALVKEWATCRDWRCYARSAAEVKVWAGDNRLRAAGLFDLTNGMRHARDGARHALFAAAKDFGLTDPLSNVRHWGNGVGGIGLAEHKGVREGCPAPECGS